MAVEKQAFTVGTVLTGKYKKTTHTCEVVETDGKVRFRLQDGKEFKSLSAAGSAITGGAINGWKFWTLASVGSSQAAVPPAAEDTTLSEPAAPERVKTKVIKRTPNQQGVPDGEVRYFCSGCMQGFIEPSGERPTHCPQGHAAESDEQGQVVQVARSGDAETAS